VVEKTLLAFSTSPANGVIFAVLAKSRVVST